MAQGTASGTRYLKAAAIYARTLLDLAKDQGVLTEVTGEMQALVSIFTQQPSVVRALHNPALSGDKKAQLVSPLLAKASALTAKVIKLLSIKNRLALLPDLAEAYLRLEEESRKVHRARVISATPLTESQLASVAQLLAARKPGATYKLENSVDTSLLSGFRVEEGDSIIDATLRHKLETIKQRLAA